MEVSHLHTPLLTNREVNISYGESQNPKGIFERILERIQEDRLAHKIKLKNRRLFDEHIFKKKLSGCEKENRSLNVASKLLIMWNALRKEGLDKKDIRDILGEYKAKLKEERDVRDARSFSQYILEKQKHFDEISEDPDLPRYYTKYSIDQNFIINKFIGFVAKNLFAKMDREFVSRFAGAEKAVYCLDQTAILTARKETQSNSLEMEYALTVDIRIKEMHRALTEKNHFKFRLSTTLIHQIISDYRKALEDENTDIVDAHTFFNCSQNFYGFYESEAIDLAAEIDGNLSAIDLARKRYIVDGVTLYKSEKAECDLKAFLSNKDGNKLSINALSASQLEDFLESFDKIKESLNRIKLLHGDIKPDNILVYKKTTLYGTVNYSVKISDFGKSKLCETDQAYQLHTGNPRFHKGLYDTFKTQQDSLDMIKLLILNSNTEIHVDEEALDQMEMSQKNLLSNCKKITDVAHSKFGYALYVKGSLRPNYFSNLNSSFFYRVCYSLKYNGNSTRNLLLENTVEDAFKILNDSQHIYQEDDKSSKTTEELLFLELETMKRVKTFTLLKKIYVSLRAETSLATMQEQLAQASAQLEDISLTLNVRLGRFNRKMIAAFQY